MGYTNVKTLSPIALAYLEWWASPDSPEKLSQAKWCEQNGVLARTAREWRKSPAWDEALTKLYHEVNVSADKIQRVVDAMHERAALGDVKAAQLYLQYVERLKPTHVVVETRSVQEMSDAELQLAWDEGLSAVS